MKLTIDTKEDSPEDLRKVITLLQNLIGDAKTNYQESKFKNIWDDSPTLFGNTESKKLDDTPVIDGAGLMTMFDQDDKKAEDKEENTDPFEEITIIE